MSLPQALRAACLLGVSLAACEVQQTYGDLASAPVDLAIADRARPADAAPSPWPLPDLAGVAPGYPAPHAPLPRVVPNDGAVLTNVRLVTVTFAGDANRAKVEGLGAFFFGSTYWRQIADEYGLGDGAQIATVHLPGPAPAAMTTRDLTRTLAQLRESGAAPSPTSSAPDQVLYLLYLPAGSTLQDAQAGTSCVDFEGFHGLSPRGKLRYPFAIVADCGRGMDRVTSTASHEIVEVATDPYLGISHGWTVNAPLPDRWYAVGTSLEIADLCAGESDFREGGYALQPIWSNTAAAADQPPCMPALDWSYYGLDASPTTVVSLAPGETASFSVRGWSFLPTPGWAIGWRVASASQLTAAEMAPIVSEFFLRDGRAAMVTLHAPNDAQPGQFGAIEVFATQHPSRSVPLAFQVR